MNTSVKFIVGDSLTVLRSMPDASVDLVVSSPPFLALRSYLPADHPDKDKEMGSEATPGAYLDALLDIVEECRRVLAPHGSLCFELGDTYAGSGGAGGDYNEGGLHDGQPKFSGTALSYRKSAQRNRAGGGHLAEYADARGNPDGMRDTTFSGANTRTGSGDGWPLDKSLCLIPESLRWAMVYGRNPFTGRETEPWRARNVVRWHRPNPPVGALGDKFRPATTDIIVACMSRKRYFDLDAVRQPAQVQMGRAVDGNNVKGTDDSSFRFAQRVDSNPGGAPPLDTWIIPTAPFKGAHYATWPPNLLLKLILSMCPERVCVTCGVPSERIVRVDGYTDHNGVLHAAGEKWSSGIAGGAGAHSGKPGSRTTTTTTGWTDCGHDDWRAGITLDPFCGSGTTLSVASGHGRSAVGIDLDERNADLARERVGMWLEVDESAGGATTREALA